MSWILMQPTIFGQVLGISDIQVTFQEPGNNNLERYDCLQKMYGIDQNLIGGFAGSVVGGFKVFDEITRFVRANKPTKNHLIKPERLFKQVNKVAQNAFEKLSDLEKEIGVHIILGCISPSRGIGLPGRGKPTVGVFKSPTFNLEKVSNLTGV